MYDEVNLSHY